MRMYSDGVKENKPTNADPAVGAVVVGVEEAALARTYLSVVLKGQWGFVERVSIEDEMYIFIRNHIPQKQYALYQYLYGGCEAVQVIDNIVQAAGKSLEGVRSFLDFACGYGKSTRFLVLRLAPQRIWVSDIYRGAVDFQKEQFGVNGFYSTVEPDDVKFPRKFEVIYVGSLFSHLPALRFKTWLQRLYEALDDDGLLIFTTAGRWGSQREGDAKGTGFTFVCESESGSLPKHEYGGTWVTEKWVRDLAAELSLARVHYLEFELWAQDVFVVTKSCTPALEALQANAYPLGAIEIAALDPSGRLRVSGWAMDRRWGAPVQSVRIEIDGALSAMAETGLTRPDVASYFERPDSECAGWYYAGHAGPIKGTFDSAVVRVLIEGRDGAVTCLVSLIEREGFEASAAGFEGPFITNDELVKHVYRVCLFREADPAELHHWTRVLDDGLDFGEVVKHFLDCDERRHIEAGGGKLYVPPGHYYSPIVATRQVTCLFDGDTPRSRGDLEISIDLNEEEQQRNWRDMVPLFGDLPFPEQPNGQTRYYYENPSYNRGDAMVLAAMLRMRRPQRVIEVGSGFSSACMLDINERYLNCQAAITFIEPYPEVLHTLLRPGDTQRTNLVCRPVQDVEVRLLEELESDDILFIDSTHVVKTGSDVIFEFFELLPRLKKGVVVHFHDMFFPFEYPRHFVIDENRSWNELYLMRAFLMYNKTFEIIFFNDFFAKRYRADIEAAAPSFLLNPGGGLWLRKCSEEERWPPSRSRLSWARLLKRVFDIDIEH